MAAKGNRFNQSNYKDSLCEKLIVTLAAGDSRACFCADHNIPDGTFSLWLKKHKEFQLAYDIGRAKCQKWWERLAKDHATYNKETDKLDHIVWSMNMRNRFGWTEHRKAKVAGIDKANTFNEQYQQVIAMLANGELTADEATKIAKLIETGVKVNESTELESRVAEIEKAQAVGFAENEFKEE